MLPTVSDVPLRRAPNISEILESNVTVGHNWCQDAGIYEFAMGATGDKVKGRYSFVYVWEDDDETVLA